MKARNYVGVSGVCSRDQAEWILAQVPPEANYFVMIGVLASIKTLGGLSNKWPKRYPLMTDVSRIFPENRPHALNLVHYATSSGRSLGMQLQQITEYGGRNLHGLQLNMTWPDPRILEKYRQQQPGKVIVLQINNDCFASVDNDPTKLAERLSTDYSGLCEYALLDASAGLGVDMNVPTVRTYIEAIQDKLPDIQIGVAGGLCADTLGNIRSLRDTSWPLSIDAEGKLRDTKDNLDPKKVANYLAQAHQLFG